MELDRYRALKEGRLSPEMILEWSGGEVTKPMTMNMDTNRPFSGGLFDEEIFGRMEDWENPENASKMGHIELMWPTIPELAMQKEDTRLGRYLDMSSEDLYAIAHYQARVLLDPEENGDPNLAYGKVFTNLEYLEYLGDHDKGPGETATGPTAIRELIQDKKLLEQNKNEPDPEWMLVKIIPVIPAWERPMLPIGDGKWVVSDLNDVYRKIIRHNRRMRRLIEMNEKPYVWVRDALAVQKACDQLFEMLDQRYRKIS